MCGGVVQEVIDAERNVGPVAGGNRGCDGADCCLHRVIDGVCIIVEDAREFLTVFELSRSEFVVGDGFGKQLFLAVHWCRIRMR